MKPLRTGQANFPHPSPSRRQQTAQRKPYTAITVMLLIVLPVLVSLQIGLKLSVANGQLVVGGIPFSILSTFLQDDLARNAYLTRDRQTLHSRLQALGVEEQIKDFYRPQISDEFELDRYIHQLFYDRTGYVGLNYWVNSEGKLVLKKGRIP